MRTARSQQRHEAHLFRPIDFGRSPFVMARNSFAGRTHPSALQCVARRDFLIRSVGVPERLPARYPLMARVPRQANRCSAPLSLTSAALSCTHMHARAHAHAHTPCAHTQAHADSLPTWLINAAGRLSDAAGSRKWLVSAAGGFVLGSSMVQASRCDLTSTRAHMA